MSDVETITHALRRLRAEQIPYLVATVVRVNGSSYRRPGARMIIGEDGTVVGGISAGCLEAALLRTAWWRTQSSDAVLVKYDSTSDDDEAGWGSGFGCNGVVEVLLEREHPASDAALDFIAGTVARQKRGCLLTVFRSSVPDVPVGSRATVTADGAVSFYGRLGWGGFVGTDELAAARRVIESGNARTLVLSTSDGGIEVLAEPVIPPPRLFVCGEGPDAVPLARYAHDLGWGVVIWASQQRWLSRERFHGLGDLATGSMKDLRDAVDASARPACLILSHHYERDRELLDALLVSKTNYIGVLGPRARALRLLMEAGAQRNAAEVRGRVHAPGFDVGAETPQEIALAVMAEIQSILCGYAAKPASLGRLGSGVYERLAPLDHQLRIATSDTWNAQATQADTSSSAAAHTR
ncbi:MAG: XdhC/CoxI family protein [Polyangiaceae bacterium]